MQRNQTDAYVRYEPGHGWPRPGRRAWPSTALKSNTPVVSSDLDLISLLLSTTEFEARPRRFYFGTEVTAHACVRPCRLLVVGHGMAPVNSDGLNWLLETPDI
jgi:hypothetical protein